MATWS